MNEPTTDRRLDRATDYLRQLLEATDSEARAMSRETTRLHLEIQGWLAAGDVLRVQMEVSEDGRPRRLFVSRGFPNGLQGGRPPVVVPGEKIGELVDAIRALEGET